MDHLNNPEGQAVFNNNRFLSTPSYCTARVEGDGMPAKNC
jgi:hypothetical protein